MDQSQHLQICSDGGKAAHQLGLAHEWSKSEASIAGKKGQESLKRKLAEKGKSFKEHMAEVGRKGGEARSKQRKPKKVPDALKDAAD